MISAEATGVLSVCVYEDVPPTSPALVRRFRGIKRQGEDYFKRVLKELREIGFIATDISKIGGRFQTESWVTSEGIDYLQERGFPPPVKSITGEGFSTPLLQQSELTSTSYISSLISKEYTGGPREEVFEKVELEVADMSWGGLFETNVSSDKLEERAQAQKFKKAEYDAAKEEARTEKLIKRQDIHPSQWTCSDVAYEFGSRIQAKWHIKPWSVRGSRFSQALGTFRKQHDTNGEIELILLDMFFSTVDLDKYDNGEILWKMFIKRSPDYLTQARGMVRTEEQLEDAKVSAKKSQEWLYE